MMMMVVVVVMMMQAVGGFLLVVTNDCDVFFASESVEQYLGFTQVSGR